MKKIIFIVCCLLLLTACSNSNIKSKDVLMSMGSVDITKDLVIKSTPKEDTKQDTLKYALLLILDKEVPVTEQMQLMAEVSTEGVEAAEGANFANFLKSAGYTTKEAYNENHVLFLMRMNSLFQLYVKDNYADIAKVNLPRTVKMMQFNDQETANKALKEVEAGAAFETISQKYASVTDAGQMLVTNEIKVEKFDDDIKAFIFSVTEPTLSEVIVNKDSTIYSIVEVVATDASLFFEQAAATLATGPYARGKAMQFYFDKYELKIYDEQIINDFKTNYGKALRLEEWDYKA